MGKFIKRLGVGLLGLLSFAIMVVYILSTVRWNRDSSGPIFNRLLPSRGDYRNGRLTPNDP